MQLGTLLSISISTFPFLNKIATSPYREKPPRLHSFSSPLSPPHTASYHSYRQQGIADLSTFPSHSHRIARLSSKYTGRPKRGTREAPPRERNNGCRRNRRLNREHRSTFQDLQASRRTSTNESARSNSGSIDYERGHFIFPRPRVRCSPLWASS